MKIPRLPKAVKVPQLIYCCSSARPVQLPGSEKVHKDPHRDLHDAIISSFLDFALRHQRNTILLQLALSHVDEIESVASLGNMHHTFGSTSTSDYLSGDFMAESIAPVAPLVPLAENDCPRPGPPSSILVQSFVSDLFVSEAPHDHSAALYHPSHQGSSQFSLEFSDQLFVPSAPISVNCNVLNAPTLNTSGISTKSHHFSNSGPTNYQCQQNVSSICSPALHTNYEKGHSSVSLSVSAKPFVPGTVRGSLPPGLETAMGNTFSSTSPLLQPTTTNTTVRLSRYQNPQNQEPQEVETQWAEGLLDLLLKTNPATPETSTNTSTPGQRFSADQTHQNHASSIGPQQGSEFSQKSLAFKEQVNTLRQLEKDAKDFKYQFQTQPEPEEETSTAAHSSFIPETTTTRSHAASFGSLPHGSPSVFTSSVLSDNSSQTAMNPASISSTPKQNVSSHLQYRQSPVPSSLGQPGSYKSSSVTLHPNASSSHSNTLQPTSNPFRSHSSSISTPLGHQPQHPVFQQQQPHPVHPTPIYDLHELVKNPLTDETSYVIHLTSRLDYGPVYSHRYFICPQDLTQDWIEVTHHQWFARGYPFKMSAEKWDLKCGDHGKFFRMTLRPNLKLRDPTWEGHDTTWDGGDIGSLSLQ